MVIVPFAAPQSVSSVETVLQARGVGSVKVSEQIVVHPLASVTVTL